MVACFRDFKKSGASRVLAVMLCAVLIALHLSTIASALPTAQKQVLREGIFYFNTGSGTTCTASVTTTLNGNDNMQKAFNFFVGKGLTANQAAAIVGNFVYESGVDPTNTNPHGGAHGIAQWLGGRKTALAAYAQAQSRPEDDLATQLDFSWTEFTGGYSQVLNKLKSSDDLVTGTTYIFSDYEAPGDSSLPDRIADAQQVLQLYGGGANAGATTATAVTGGNCSGITGPGQDTVFADGFTFYSQCDPTWGTSKYGTGTICADGCGPSSMAMIITNLTGDPVTPDQTAPYADSQNLYISGSGSSWNIAPVLAAHWGLKATPIDNDVTKITAALQAGALVAVAGQGSLPFTPGGHYIVIRGVTADGKWKIGDPDTAPTHKDSNTKEWDPAQIVTNMHAGSAYAISKK